MRSTILSSKAKSTVSKYSNGFNRFWLWAKTYSEISSVLPTSELHASLYLQFLIDSCKHYSSVESAFYSIKWAHNLANLEDPCDSDFVRSIVEASKRLLNRPILMKTPVDADVIKSLFNNFSFPRSLTDLRLLPLCSLPYTGILRYDESSSIRARHLLFQSEYLEIVIPSSKTDCYRKGNRVFIARTNSEYCAVAILDSYLKAADIDLKSDMIIFRSVTNFKTSNTFLLRKQNIKLSYTPTREIVLSALSDIGLHSSEYGLHSFRAGGTTADANSGVPDRLFKLQGRWKTDIAKDGYVLDNVEKRLSVSKSLSI